MKLLFLFLIFSGVYTCIDIIKLFIGIIYNYKRIRQLKKELPNVQSIDKKTVCQEPHVWEEVTLAMLTSFDDKNPTTHQKLICSKCGVISSTESQLNEAGMKVLVERRQNEARCKKAVESIEKIKTKTFDNTFFKFVKNNNVSKDDIQLLEKSFKLGLDASDKFNETLYDQIKNIQNKDVF